MSLLRLILTTRALRCHYRDIFALPQRFGVTTLTYSNYCDYQSVAMSISLVKINDANTINTMTFAHVVTDVEYCGTSLGVLFGR